MSQVDCPFPFHVPLQEPCFFCEGPGWIALTEIWSSHEFQIDACCEGLREEVITEMAADPEYRLDLLKSLGAETVTGHDLRRVADDGVGYLLDYQLEMRSATIAESNAFIDLHHRHVGPLNISRFRGSIWNGPTMVGVIVVGNPCARAFNHQGVLEVRRLCVNPHLPDSLRWKACSFAYGWAAAEAQRLGWDRLITYTLESEEGLSLRYARWKRRGAASKAGKTWDSPSRRRNAAVRGGALEAKVLWDKKLTPTDDARTQRLVREDEFRQRNARRRTARDSQFTLPGVFLAS